jgi:hypothetical protein
MLGVLDGKKIKAFKSLFDKFVVICRLYVFKVVPEIPPTARSDRSANPTISAVLVAARKYKIKDTNLSAAIIRGCNTRHHAR